MRRALVSVGLLAVLLVVALSTMFVAGQWRARLAGALTETVAIGSATLDVGEQGSVDLEAQNIGSPGLGAWTIDIVYDPSVVSAVSCNSQVGGICNPQFASDTVRAFGATASGLEGDTTLATVTFECDAGGVSALTLSVLVFADATLGDPQDIAATTQDGSITCTEPPPVSITVDSTTGNISGFFGSVDFPVEFAAVANVTFSSPLSIDDYVVLLTPVNRSCIPAVTAKTAAGFSFVCSAVGGGSVGWAVLVGLAPGAPPGPGAPTGGGPPGGSPGGPGGPGRPGGPGGP